MGEGVREEILEKCFNYVRSLAQNCKGCMRKDSAACGMGCVCFLPGRIIRELEDGVSLAEDEWSSLEGHVVDRRRRLLAVIFRLKDQGWTLKNELPQHGSDKRVWVLNDDIAWLRGNGFVETMRNGQKVFIRITAKGKGALK